MEFGVSELIVNPTAVSQPEAVSLRDADNWTAVMGGGRKSASGVKINTRSVMGYPPFWRGVNLLANGVSGLPLEVYQRSGTSRSPAEKHPARKILRKRASPVMLSRKWVQTSVGQALVYGNSFSWIERDPRRMQPTALWVLDPDKVVIRFVDNELWYCTWIDNEPRKFPGRDIFHICGLSPNGVGGYSALDLFHDALGVGMAAQKFGGRFFGEGSNASGILMIPGRMDEERMRNAMKDWQTMNSGLNNSHKVALLQEGVKYQQLTVPPEAAQFLQTRDYEVRATVASILGVPPHLLGDATRTSHNSLESEAKSLLQHSIDPWLQELEDEAEAKLLSEEEQDKDSHFVEFNREASVAMLFAEKMDGIHKEVEIGILTVNEARAKLNEPDVGPEGDIRYRPANWVPATEGTEPEPDPMAPPTVPPVPPVPPEPEEAPEARRLLASLITRSVEDSLAYEQRRILAAVKKVKNFISWAESFYRTDWLKTSMPAITSGEAVKAKEDHAAESMRQLVEVAASATAATLPGQVVELLGSWGDRAEALAQKLIISR